MIVPAGVFHKNIIELYGLISVWLVKDLESLGIEAELKPINDIIIKRQKDLRKRPDKEDRDIFTAQHPTLDLKTMFSVLNMNNQKITDKMIKIVTCVGINCNLDKRDIY